VKLLIKGIFALFFFCSWGYKKSPKGTHFVRAKSGVLMFHINSPWKGLVRLKIFRWLVIASKNHCLEILTIFFKLV